MIYSEGATQMFRTRQIFEQNEIVSVYSLTEDKNTEMSSGTNHAHMLS